MYCRMEGTRPPSRIEARMAVVPMKRATAARNQLIRREEATVGKLGGLQRDCSYAGMWGSGRLDGVLC